MTRDEYIDFVKEQEALEEQQNFEPPQMQIPTVKEFGVQCSPPTPPMKYHDPPSPRPPQLDTHIDMRDMGVQMSGDLY